MPQFRPEHLCPGGLPGSGALRIRAGQPSHSHCGRGDTSTPGYVDLQGPVVGLSQGVDGCYLILTLSSSHSERFVLEHLDIKDGSRQTELLPGDIESYSFAGGDLILLFKDGSLMRCRHECSPAYLFPAPRSESPRLIAATPGGNFLFVVVEERNRTRVHLFAQTP